MSEEYRFDPIDILRFMPVALRQATRKGYLDELKKGNDVERKYFALCGNLLYSFAKENDPSSLCGIMFLESSILKISSVMGTLALSVSAVGGKTIQLVAASQTELVEWMEAIENSKFISLSRKLEDTEARALQLHHQVEQQEVVSQDYAKSFVEMKEEIKALAAKNKEQEAAMLAAKTESRDLRSQLKSSEKERSLLLKSRGITPKELPLWALSEQPRGGVLDMPESIRIWTGTWNLGSSEPFAGMDKNRAQRLLQPLVPPGYDLYVLGVQECVSDSVFDSMNGLLEAEGCRRLRLDNFSSADAHHGVADLGSPSVSAASASSGLAAPIPSCTGIGMGNGAHIAPGDLSKLVGRGDGSLMSMKYTGIAIYAHVDILADVRLLSVTNIPFSTTNSRGGVAVALSIMGRTVAFVCCQLDIKSNDARKEQYQSLVTGLGSQLAELGYHMNEQFHHVIWCGDFSYTLVDTSGNRMPPDTVVKMLQDGRLFRTLFESHDQLNQEKKEKAVFFGYREAAPFPNFYPTYKRVENRNPVDYTNPAWVTNTYRTYKKAPFFKGGAVKEYTPCFSDRILYHSMVDLAEDLVPECLPVEMNVYKLPTGADSPASSSSRSSGRSRGSTASEQSSGGQRSSAKQVVSIVGAGPPIPNTIAVVVDNYRSVNDGEGLNVSDHAPVFGTFILRLRHNFEKILSDSVLTKSTGSIRNVLTALSATDASSTVEFPAPGRDAGQPAGLVTPPRPKSSSRFGTAATDPVKKRSALTTALHESASGVAAGAAPSAPQLPVKIPKYSLLPPGMYRVRVSGIKLIWGMNEEVPSSASMLFPAPFEAVAGERFVDFMSDLEVPAAATTEDAFSLSSLSTSIAADTYSTPSRGRPQSAQLAQSVPSPRHLGASSKQPAKALEQWERAGPSRTGTSLCISAGTYYRHSARHAGADSSGSLTRSSSSQAMGGTGGAIAPVVLTWRGAEPLDKLHISMRVCIPAFSYGGGKSRPGSSRTTADAGTPGRAASSDGASEDFLTGHCAVGMEQLCKVAMVSSGGLSGSVTVTRILVNNGRPMYNIDSRTLQREMVTMCCTLELLPNQPEREA